MRFIKTAALSTIVASIGTLLLIATQAFGASAPSTESESVTPTWLGPEDLGPSGGSAGPSGIAVDAGGSAVVAWAADNVETSFRPAIDGLWEKPTSLASSGSASARANPQVALDGSGDAVAVWLYSNGQDFAVRDATKRAGTSAWQAPVDLSNAGTEAKEPHIVIDEQGDAVAVWAEYKGSDFVIEAAVTQASSGVWGPAVQLSPAGSSVSHPSVALDQQGDATVVWRQYDHIGEPVVQTVSSSGPVANAGWQAPVVISGTGEAVEGEPEVALDAQGDAVAVWQRRGGGSGVAVVGTTRPGDNGSWRAPVQLSSGDGPAGHPSVAVDANGQAVAVWEAQTAEEVNVQAAVGSVTLGAWQAAVKLATTSRERARECPSAPYADCPAPRPTAEPQVAVDGPGDAIAVWLNSSGSTQGIVEAALRPSGANAWQKPASLSGATANGPRVALDAYGDAVATWVTVSATNSTVQSDTLSNRLTIANASLSRIRFRVPGRRAGTWRRVKRHLRVATRLRFKLSAAAHLRVRIVHHAAEARLRRRCSPTQSRSGAARIDTGCTHSISLGTFENVPEPPGVNSLSFDGRIAHRALRPGNYKAVLLAHNHNERSRPVVLPFTILR